MPPVTTDGDTAAVLLAGRTDGGPPPPGSDAVADPGSIPVRPQRAGPPGGRRCVGAAAAAQGRPPTSRPITARTEWDTASPASRASGLFQDACRRPSASRFPRGPRSRRPVGHPSRLRRRCGRCTLPTADSWPTVPDAPILKQPCARLPPACLFSRQVVASLPRDRIWAAARDSTVQTRRSAILWLLTLWALLAAAGAAEAAEELPRERGTPTRPATLQPEFRPRAGAPPSFSESVAALPEFRVSGPRRSDGSDGSSGPR
jgi:hypothetical protein